MVLATHRRTYGNFIVTPAKKVLTLLFRNANVSISIVQEILQIGVVDADASMQTPIKVILPAHTNKKRKKSLNFSRSFYRGFSRCLRYFSALFLQLCEHFRCCLCGGCSFLCGYFSCCLHDNAHDDAVNT